MLRVSQKVFSRLGKNDEARQMGQGGWMRVEEDESRGQVRLFAVSVISRQTRALDGIACPGAWHAIKLPPSKQILETDHLPVIFKICKMTLGNYGAAGDVFYY